MLGFNPSVQKRQTNVKSPARWSYIAVCTEFGIDRKTLTKKVFEAEIVPGEDGLFSTKQIMDALTGDMKAQRLRLVKSMAENSELKAQKHRGELLPAKDVLSHLSLVFFVMRSEILSSSMTDTEKRSVLSHLADIDVAKL
jgi:hypothetical protein